MGVDWTFVDIDRCPRGAAPGSKALSQLSEFRVDGLL
jgi:hypothetical protein